VLLPRPALGREGHEEGTGVVVEDSFSTVLPKPPRTVESSLARRFGPPSTVIEPVMCASVLLVLRANVVLRPGLTLVLRENVLSEVSEGSNATETTAVLRSCVEDDTNVKVPERVADLCFWT
jgi:hypothetical protein